MITFFKTLLIFLISFFTIMAHSKAEGDLTRKKPIEKVVFLKGNAGKEHFFEPNVLEFKTGNLYKLIIINNSTSKHYFTSEGFAKAVFTRKIQVKNKKKMVAEIKGVIYEVEVFPNQFIEWWFVPVKTGKFDDLNCKVKDKETNKKHSDMGMVGEIIIK